MKFASILLSAVTTLAIAISAMGMQSTAWAQQASGQLGDGVYSLQIRLNDAEHKALEPAAPAFGGFGGPPPAPRQTAPADANREHVANLFGTQFPWVRGTLSGTVGDTKFADLPCRVRYDGEFTYMMAGQSSKRTMFAECLDGKNIDGVTSFRLHTMQLDQTLLRERIAAHVFASIEATVTRTAHAEVSIVVGDSEPNFIGLYTILEAVDASFLARNNIPESSLLLQINGVNTIAYAGNDWNVYAPLFRSKSVPNKAQQDRLIAFAKLIGDAPNKEFDDKIGEFIDANSLLRYRVANSLTSNLTGLSSIGANDTLCLDADGKFHIVASQMETALGGSILAGTPEQLADLRLMRPYAGECKLIDRLMMSGTFKELYLAIVREAVNGFFAPTAMNQTIGSIETNSAKSRERETKAAEERMRQAMLAFGGVGRPPPGGGFGPPAGGAGGFAAPAPMDSKSFIAKRNESISKQLNRAENRSQRYRAPPAWISTHQATCMSPVGGVAMHRFTSARKSDL